MARTAEESLDPASELQPGAKLRVKRPFHWTARKQYKKDDLFDTAKCSKQQLERVAAMCDSGGFFEC